MATAVGVDPAKSLSLSFELTRTHAASFEELVGWKLIFYPTLCVHAHGRPPHIPSFT